MHPECGLLIARRPIQRLIPDQARRDRFLAVRDVMAAIPLDSPDDKLNNVDAEGGRWCLKTGLVSGCIERALNSRSDGSGNAARRAVDLCDLYERPVATWAEARAILGLRSPA